VVAVAELVGRLGVTAALDDAVGSIKQRDRGLTAGQFLVAVAQAPGLRHVSAFRGTPAGPESGPEGRRNSRRTETPAKVNRC